MKKIIVTIDAIAFNDNALKYALSIAKQSGGMVLGVFLHDLSYVYADLPGIFDLVPVEYNHIIEKQHEDSKKIIESMRLFNDVCNEYNVKHKAHVYDGTGIVDFLIKESVFADLLVLDEQMSFAAHQAGHIPPFVSDILEEAFCPVLVIPGKYVDVENVFLCYDGSPSSVKAIKMYSYLFPEWNNKNTTLVSFNSTASTHLTNSQNIKDLLNQRFQNLKLDVEHEKRAGDSMLSYFKLKEEKALIVMGAYGRNAFSRLLKKSTANSIITNTEVPVFITHE
ncbi:MAG: hypothetical protein RJA25_2591 [Bacteroidota bacterium]|jgi:nucleotide-binding universal stress UspA family protein